MNDFDISTLIPDACRNALQSFYSEVIEVKGIRDRVQVSLPLMNADGFQISIGIGQISEKSVLLSDLGETLAFLDCRGVFTKQEAIKALVEKHLASFEIEAMGQELTKIVSLPLQGIDLHLFGEALAGLTYLMFRHEVNQARNEHVYNAVRRNLTSAKLPFVTGNDAHIPGQTSKSIQVDFLVSLRRRLAIKAVQRRGRMHDYMEQWGFRWIEAKSADPTIVRAMVYDPENQDWDENSLAIGNSHCEIFRPYFEFDLIQADLARLALAA